MPDRRQHRGPNPRDSALFAPERLPALRAAARDYGWLLSRGYATDSALALVGNRYDLVARQRVAVARVSCSDDALARRASRRLSSGELSGRRLHVDGFNVCITLEVALSGGVLLLGREGATRDLASVHGTYRRVSETPHALELLVAALETLRPGSVTWFFDRPVSNSGALAGLLRAQLAARALSWPVELTTHVDERVAEPGVVALSADSGVLDTAEHWFDLAGSVSAGLASAWRVALW